MVNGSVDERIQAMATRICIIGVGNEFRTDDAVGIVVARKLKELGVPGAHVCELSGEGGGLMEAWNGMDIVFLVDAVSSGAPAGTIFTIDARQRTIPSQFFHYSTHAFSLAESVELAKVLDRLPDRCMIYGIEGKEFGEGTGLTHAVLLAVDKVVSAILKQVRIQQSGSRGEVPADKQRPSGHFSGIRHRAG